ncbi:MAG: MFS transporter [Bacillaceae bacterium]|nr:MFS transporter [Bacillaceae bacterium]
MYTLGLAIGVAIIGKFSDQYGRKKIFLIEVFLFTLGSFLVAISPNFIFMLIARFIQAIGGGGLIVVANAYILSMFLKKFVVKPWESLVVSTE